VNTYVERALTHIESMDGRFYETWGANDGPTLRRWEGYWGMKREPWCAIGLAGLLLDTGRDVYDAYGGSRLFSPSTGEMCQRARNLGWIWNGRGSVPPGALWINCGIHVEIVTDDLGADAGMLATTGCNVSNGIYDRIRYTQGYTIIVPPGILPPPPPKFETIYWLEDTLAKPYVVGQWRLKKNRDRALAKMQANPVLRQEHPRPQAHGPKSAPYQIIAGGIKRYGSFPTHRRQQRVKHILEKRLGHTLRPYNTKREVKQ
jgi:hypothetical protein